MTCGWVRRRLSAHVDGELRGSQARGLQAHLEACPACAARSRTLRAALALLAEEPPLGPPESVASRVLSRLEVEGRGPGLALLFRPFWAARPLMLPSLVPAALVLVSVLAVALALDRDPRALAQVVRGQAWQRRAPAFGTEANPLFPSSGVSVPQLRSRGPIGDGLLAAEGSLFIETVVARDGTVSAVTLLEGDRAQAAPVVDALRRELFEPGRFRGRPVAVSLYRLISRMEVRAPLT